MTAGTNLENIRLNVISQTQKDRYYMISLICEILKKKKNPQKQRVELPLSGNGDVGNGDVDQRV